MLHDVMFVRLAPDWTVRGEYLNLARLNTNVCDFAMRGQLSFILSGFADTVCHILLFVALVINHCDDTVGLSGADVLLMPDVL